MSDDNFSLPTITLDEFQQAPLTALENSSSVEVCVIITKLRYFIAYQNRIMTR